MICLNWLYQSLTFPPYLSILDEILSNSILFPIFIVIKIKTIQVTPKNRNAYKTEGNTGSYPQFKKVILDNATGEKNRATYGKLYSQR